MKRKNGFTLIELLAVIVILAIIAVIATPIIVGLIEDAREESFERSVEMILKSTDLDFGTQDILENYTYTITNGEISNMDIPVQNTTGFNGTIRYNSDGKSSYAINNGKWCITKGYNDEKGTVSENIDDCILTTDESCFTYVGGVEDNEYAITDKEACKTFMINENGYTEEEAIPYCNNEPISDFGNLTLTEYLSLFTEENDGYEDMVLPLIDNNIVSQNLNDGITITDYDIACGANVTIPNTINNKLVTKIGKSAFENKGITSIKLNEGLQTIEKYAFFNNPITSVDIPTSIISIEDASFVGNNLNNESIEKISLINNIALYTSCDDSCFTYQDVEGGIEITDYDETCPREVVIPSKIENKNVVTIGEQSLYYNYSLSSIYGGGHHGDITSVVIPNTVTTIKALAFTGNQISNVVFGSGLITIENEILKSNQLSGTLDLSNLKKLEKIDYRAFSYNQLTGAIIPSNVTYIGCSVFGDNDTSFSGTYNGTTFDQDYNPCGAN